MKTDGYTLAEAAAALLIVGLAIGGVAEGARMIARTQGAAGRTVAAERAARAVDAGLTGLLAGRGPFRSDEAGGLSGDRARFSFHCGSGAPCAAALARDGGRLRLDLTEADGRRASTSLPPAVAGARFEYRGDAGALDAWPPAGDRQTLRTVTLVVEGARGDEPLAVARLWGEQEADCEFDSIARDCRRRAP